MHTAAAYCMLALIVSTVFISATALVCLPQAVSFLVSLYNLNL